MKQIQASRPARRGLLRPLIGVAIVLVVANAIAWPPGALGKREGPGIISATRWGYQLQRLDLDKIPDAIDLLVIDYSKDGSDAAALAPAEVQRLATRASGKRIVLAYLSIGEAERYRYYWQGYWRWWKPGWLGPENPQWKGNYPVRFWDAGWQRILLDPDRTLFGALAQQVMPSWKPYLDRILEAGFDGVYLDRVDVHSEWEKEKPDAEKAMVKLVAAISSYAKARRPGFLVVPQNAEELLRLKAYRSVIDAVAKEDLVFGIDGDGKRNGKAELKSSLGHLDKARGEGVPVLVVEYLDDPEQQREALEVTAKHGFVPLFARRPLDRPPALVPSELATPAPSEERKD
jgi:cysteinyl-tRNA synthetase